MNEPDYNGRPKAVTAITSMSSLLVGEQSRREVRVPRRDQIPANVAWLKDRNNVEYPAIIGITGRVTEARYVGDMRVTQWNLSCFPNHPLAHERLSRQDMQDLVEDLHKDLARIGVLRGSWYTAYFSVPMYGGNNFFESHFDGASAVRREREAELRKSWNPAVIFRRMLGRIPQIPDPWLEDKAAEALVTQSIRDHGAKILGKVWDKWSQAPDVAPTLRMLRVPLDDPRQTVYRHGDPHQRIFDNLPPISRKTMFQRDIPDDYEEAIERRLSDQA
ncbi:MAG: hypothetical protein WCO25_03665 [Candidatus Uhrbacteria bacterium]